MNLLLICGSLRAGSTNEAVLRTAAQFADATFYAGMGSLPLFNPDDDHDPLHAAVVDLRTAIDDADAMLICTPEYAGDMPGGLKNLLDWTVGGVETEGKRVAWINAHPSPDGAAGTHRALGVVLRYTGCDVVEDACAHIPLTRDAVQDGIVTDPAIRSRIGDVVRRLSAR